MPSLDFNYRTLGYRAVTPPLESRLGISVSKLRFTANSIQTRLITDVRRFSHDGAHNISYVLSSLLYSSVNAPS